VNREDQNRDEGKFAAEPLHSRPAGWRDRDFIDFPTGWWLADIVEHLNPLCSYAQTNGALLCDCGAIQAEWERRREVDDHPGEQQ
jgi:hypothetical protein